MILEGYLFEIVYGKERQMLERSLHMINLERRLVVGEI